jgi:hypothetical protein
MKKKLTKDQIIKKFKRKLKDQNEEMEWLQLQNKFKSSLLRGYERICLPLHINPSVEELLRNDPYRSIKEKK